MSDNQGATSAPSLEEALAEIEGLKEQLSGSDLKVFTQNRELRQENGKLREEVTRLTEECVTQTFAVRGLEKSKSKLEKQISDLESKVADLESQVSEQSSKLATQESKIAELEGRTSELTDQLGVHRSQEIHLSQELERAISTNAEELSRLKNEHSEELQSTRQTLEQARAELERELAEKLAAKAREVEGLEKRVEQFKEEFLSQEFVAATVAPLEADEGRAFRLLRSKMEGLLGFPGKTLVEQVFRHCGADETTSDPAVLEEAFEALQDTASKLVRNPEQEQELASLLKSAWQDLGLGSTDGRSASSETEPDPASPAEPVAESAEPVAESAEPVAESAKPVAESAEPVAESAEPVAESAESAEPVAESAGPVAASDEPVAESAEPVAESAEPVAESAEPVAESAEPVAESAEPVAESAEPVAESDEPVAESAEHVAESAEHVAESAEPVAESAEPAAESAEAVAESAEPVAESTEPEEAAAQDHEPAAETIESEPEAAPEVDQSAEPLLEAAAEPEATEAPPQESDAGQPTEEASAEPEPEAATEETVPPGDEASLAPPETSLPDSEAVTEEDMPAVSPPEPAAEVEVDSMDEGLSQPSMEEVAAEPAAEEPVAEAADEEAPAEPTGEASPSETPEESAATAADAPTETIEVAEAQPEAITEMIAPEPEPEESPAEEQASEADGEEDTDFDVAAAALQNGDFAKAWPVFNRLRLEAPNEPTYLVGEIASLAGLDRFAEAYALGKGLDIEALEDSAEVYKESFESVLLGLAEQAESMLVRKMYLIELIDLVDDQERVLAFLDEVEEIALRTPREGELSLLQAKHRIGQDDVTEYLIDALGSLSDKPEVFSLLGQNLERYPELAPLREFVARLLDSSRDEALEAETSAKDLITGDEAVEDLLEEVDPGEEALVQVFLEHLLPRTGVKVDLPSESFEELLQEAEPAAFVGALRQALRSVDYTIFFDEIEVLSYDGDEHFLLRSSPEPKPTLLFGSDVDDVPPEELRFLVLRELFSMYRRHSHLAHLAAQLDDKLRYTFVKTCLEIHKEAEFQIPEALLTQLSDLDGLAAEGGQDPEFRAKLESGLNAIYQATESDSFLELADFLFDGQLHKKWLDPLADAFAAKQTGLVVASFAIARDTLSSDDFGTLEESGFQWLYQGDNLEKFRDLRFRLQRLWVMPFKALVSDAEE